MACNEHEASETREEMKLRPVSAFCSLLPFGSDADAELTEVGSWLLQMAGFPLLYPFGPLSLTLKSNLNWWEEEELMLLEGKLDMIRTRSEAVVYYVTHICFQPGFSSGILECS